MRKLRLRDELLIQGYEPPGFIGQALDWPVYQRALALADVVICDNVAAYWYANAEYDSLKIEHYPNLAPPWPVTFYEYETPRQLRHFGKLIEWYDHPHCKLMPVAVGFLAVSYDLADTRSRARWQEHPMRSLLTVSPPNTTRWVIEWLPFFRKRDTVRWGPLGAIYDYLGEDGALLPQPDGCPHNNAAGFTDPRLVDSSQEMVKTYLMAVQKALFAVYLAICFLHCKNTTLTDYPPARHVVRQLERAGQPVRRHHVLDVGPATQLLQREGRIDVVGIERALHICRGHFKDYRKQGLFGQHHAIYWWDMHVRGAAKHGIVEKDYAVHP